MTKKAFTLTEIMVVVAIISILGTIVAASVLQAADNAKIAKIAALAQTLEVACEAFHEDTGTYAVELSDYNNPGPYYHALSSNSGVIGWKGPYIKNPLTTSDNPFGKAIYVSNDIQSWTGFPGFDLNGDGVVEANVTNSSSRDINYLGIAYMTEFYAKRIDDLFDKGVPTTTANWRQGGRVVFTGNASTGGYVNIYLAGGR